LARKILLADDSVTAQNMGRKILADAGYDVVTVNNGSAALKRITEIKPDLIVLDVYMPGYSGLEVCQRLKDATETAHIPVLLTVGKLEPFKPDEARRVKADGHIVKPFEASELLTAIARLEDRMVPQQSEGTRFSGEGSGRKTESSAGTDSSWKNRLGFASKKKKEEPETESEDVAAGASFRDFRKGKVKTESTGFTVKATPPEAMAEIVPDIPRDITPEELDALSALVAKLDVPQTEDAAPPREEMGPGAEFVAAKTEPEVPAAAVEATLEENTEVESRAVVVEHDTAEHDTAEHDTAVVEAPPLAVEGKTEVEIPVEHVEPAALVAEAAAVETHEAETQPPEMQSFETQHPEMPDAVATVAVDTAALAQEPAPVDRNDEPMFASLASASEQGAEQLAEPQFAEPQLPERQLEERPVEAVGESVAVEAVAQELASKPEETTAAALQTQESQAEKFEQPVSVAASGLESTEAEDPAPSDEDLAAALRLLTPATGQADGSMIPSRGMLVAAGQLLAEEAARFALAAPRWIAEPVAMTPEEAATSLEAEMFRTFGTMPASTSGVDRQGEQITGVSAIAATVENRLAEAEMAASAKVLAEQGIERTAAEHSLSEHSLSGHSLSGHGSEATVEATSAGEVTAAVSSATTPAEGAIAAENIEPVMTEAAQKDSAAKVAEEVPVEAVAAATLAAAAGQNGGGSGAEQNGDSVSGTPAAVAAALVTEENRDSRSDARGRQSMGKEAKSKSRKSNWRQIRTAAPSAAASSEAVEAPKPSETAAEEAPKTMAAAAAAESSAPTPNPASSMPDASTIASIVDSVMADLRPKIVEEIARKLAGK
jgi:CheY-like chemotaxis protein